MKPRKQLSSPNGLLMLAMALAVLLPSLYGFGTKLVEFIVLFRGDADGAFAISPVLNYLLASLGFLCLFGWAAMNGMFRDVERPKITMLENEARLDAASQGVADLRQLIPPQAAGLRGVVSTNRFGNPS